jgi:molybdate transport system substrate-binding protein
VRRRALPLLAAALLPAACGGGDAPGSERTVTVFAAASLSEVLEQLAQRFEQDEPGTSVRLSFGPSSSLATQIVEGAPADVFASASPRHTATVVAAGLAAEPQVLARNRAQIAVPPDDPAGISSVADLARPGVTVAVCAEEVPCGELAATVFQAAGVTVTPTTVETDVRAVLTKVALGEVDAGLVYVTDVLAAGDRVRGVDVPAAQNGTTDYTVALVGDDPAPAAEAFVRLVLSAAGREVLSAAGFQLP